jgi:hypothetical protein
VEEEVSELGIDLKDVRGKMQELKAKLYGKFGTSINL